MGHDGISVGPWSSLRALGRSRSLRSSFLWMALVPIAAKVLSGMSDVVVVRFHGQEYTFALSLPFSWQVFYFSAVCFALASLIFSLACPQIVKEFASFPEFQATGRSGLQLNIMFLQLLGWSRMSPKYRFAERNYMAIALSEQGFRRACARHKREFHDNRPRADIAFDLLLMYDDEVSLSNLAVAFWHVRDFADVMRPVARFACWILYAVGFALLAVVLVQNFIFVAQHVNIAS